MRPLNNDMDELFRKAAEDYPLQTNSSDWEKFLHNLPEDKFSTERSSKKKGFLFAALSAGILFLPLAIAVSHINFFSPGNSDSNNKKIFTSSSTKQSPTRLPIAENIQKTNTALQAYTGNDATVLSTKYVDYAQPIVLTNNQNAIQAFNSTKVSNKNMFKDNVTALQLNEHLLQTTPDKIPVSKANTNAMQVKHDNDATPAKFYVGAFIAPEITSVKLQPFKKAGFNGGVILGYNINPRLQLETGLVLAQKFYSSDGKYAAKNSLRKDNSLINNIDASASITALPLTVRYAVNTSDNAKLSVGAGAVSYVIHKEKYDYQYTKNGEEKEAFRKYNKASNNLFSNLQLSVTYDRSLMHNSYLRVEPYAGIPLNGLGLSNLPITNFGVNIGFVKYIK